MVRWDKDDRPASLFTRAYLRGMRLARDKRAFEGAGNTARVARKRQREGSSPPSLVTGLATKVTADVEDDVRVWRVRPRRRRPVARVVYLHGGGYVHPLTADYWRLIRRLSTAPAEVIVPDYPLSPSSTIDDVLPRLVDMAGDVDTSESGAPLVLMGDSAGGALALAIALRLRDLGMPPPARIVALSPWLDATLDEEAVRALEPTDPMLAESGLRAAGRWWAGLRDPSDPLVSPMNAVLSGLPPVDLFIGDRDILRPAVDSFAERAEADGTDLHVHEVTAMFHVWMTRAVPEGRRTRRQLVEILRSLA